MRRFSFLTLMLIGCSSASPSPDTRPAATTSRRPLERPTTIAEGERRWFVMRHVYLGITDPWTKFGFDLDRRTTSANDSRDSTNSCRRRVGTHSSVLVDGIDGIDNNFGQHVMALVKSVKSDAEDVANAEIASGTYSLVLRIDGAVSGDNAKAPGALYAVGPYADGKPTFAPGEQWPVWSSTLVDGIAVEKPVRRFPLGYVRNGTWVSGEIGEGPEPIWIPMFGALAMRTSALVTLDLASGRGLLAGALPVSELERFAESWLARLDICREEVFAAAVDTIQRGADVVLGAPDLQDVSRECDAVSLGLGLDMVPVAAPTAVVAPPAAPRACSSDGS